MKITRYDLLDNSILVVSLASFQFILIPMITKFNVSLGFAAMIVGGFVLFFTLVTMIDSKSWLESPIVTNVSQKPRNQD